MKKLFSVLLCAITAVIVCRSTTQVYAEETKSLSTAKAAYLVDYNSDTVLYARNENSRLQIASMCKIMTLLIIFEEIDSGNLGFDEEISVSETASGMGGSQAFLEAHYNYKCNELIKSIVIASANDSCVALAERICGSEDVFVEKMNERAEELGMTNTLFRNCTGLPKPTQYCSAKDAATMFRKLIEHKEYFNYSTIWMEDIKHKNNRITGLTNTNKLVRFYDGCDGGKTGYTSEAGHCLTATAKRGGMRLIGVVIGGTDSKTRFNEVSGMFNYAFANFTNKMVLDKSNPMEITVRVEGGKKDSVNIISKEDKFLFSKKNAKEDIRVDFEPIGRNRAPVEIGDKVGELIVFRDNIEVARCDAVASEKIGRKHYFDYVIDIFGNWGI